MQLSRRKSDNAIVIIKQIPVEEMTREERQAALNEVKVGHNSTSLTLYIYVLMFLNLFPPISQFINLSASLFIYLLLHSLDIHA